MSMECTPYRSLWHCNICSAEFAIHPIDHISSHIVSGTNCVCGTETDSVPDILVHFHLAHISKKFICLWCDYQTWEFWAMIRHIVSHIPEQGAKDGLGEANSPGGAGN